MSDKQFSGPGDRPTMFETELLASAQQPDDVWVLIGQRIGAEALFAIFDEIGGEKVSVPSRESFVRRLYQPQRDEAIVHAFAELGLPLDDIARSFGLDRSVVGKIVRRRGTTCRAPA